VFRPERIPRHLLAHLVGYLASTQTWFMVGGHAGWIFLIAIALQEGAAGDVGRFSSRLFLDGFVLLGGTDGDGRGNPATVMRAFGNLSLLVYGGELLIEWLWRKRDPLRLRTRIAIAAGFAFAGYPVGFMCMYASNATINSTPGDAVFAAFFMALFTTGASAWGLAVMERSRKARERILAEPAAEASGVS
jgi:hypothetical protein